MRLLHPHPLFANLVHSFLDESKNTELIRWSDRGDSFVVLDEDEFAKTLIPELFKHNNYASFVRQLNMYGFHKRVGLSDNSMKASERKNKSPSEYYNQFFKRGHPNLLWLINKPKGGTSKSKKGKKGGDEAHDGGSDDEGHEIEEVYGNNVPHARAISQAPETGPLQRRDMTVLQNQLLEIQKQQGNITNAISRLRNDHNELYQQARAFQSLHDRHENSIQAILTFLATVYNRSLDGQGPQNFAQMFAPGIPHDNHGSVVDIKDVTDQQDQTPGNLSPHRRQRLLMAPPGQGGGGGTPSTIVSSAGNTPNPQLNQGYSTPQSAAIEELFDSPADTTSPKLHSKQDASHQAQQPRQNMMNIINSTNAQARAQRPGPGNSTNPQQGHLQFPAVLSHYENSNGGTALTNAQRNEMLNLMAATAPNATSNSNNALVSPSPEIPSVADIQYTQAEIDDLLRLQRDQEERISSIKSQIEPLSPSGSIPGLSSDVGGYFENAAGDGNGSTISGLDLDQFLDFGNGNLTAGNGMGGFDDHFGDASVGMDGVDVGEGESDFDFGLGGTVDQGMNGNLGAAGTAGQDRSGTPEISGYEAGRSGANEEQGPRSPSKRRKRN